MEFSRDLPAEMAREQEPRLLAQWGQWERELGARVEARRIEIARAELPGLYARTRGQRIELSPRLKQGNFAAVLRHELAHAFLDSACERAGRNPVPVALGEAFALWLSGDEARVLEKTEFLLAAQARDWLERRGLQAEEPSSELEQALARLLQSRSPEQAEAWRSFFRETLRSCQGAGLDPDAALTRLASLLMLPEPGSKRAPADFALLDLQASEDLAEEGRPGQAFPVASVLKPLLVAEMPALLTRIPARKSPLWNCPMPVARGEEGRMWGWEDALARSCNGFFVDAEKRLGAADWKRLRTVFQGLGIRAEAPTAMAAAIGLVSPPRLSALEVARAYRWISLTSPHVLEALRETAARGTLAGRRESAWFRARGFALKSGTARALTGEPEHGWIVAAGRGLLAVIHQEGASPAELLPELKRRLAAAAEAPERPVARVQILGLVPRSALTIGCAPGAGPLASTGPSGDWELPAPQVFEGAGLREGQRLLCLGGPLEAGFPSRSGQAERRRYRGLLEVSSPPEREAPTAAGLPARERPARARRGSSLILATSERSYLEEALLSEFPGGNRETLQALALVLRSNLRSDRHPGRPICDTTHCQVFGPGGDRASAALRRRVREAVVAVSGEEIRPRQGEGSVPWLSFALGGSAPWKETRSPGLLRERLDLRGELRSLELLERPVPRLKVVAAGGETRELDCEAFRNQLQLRSCPRSMRLQGSDWVFEGEGEGHGLGLQLEQADTLAMQGAKHAELVSRYFPGLQVSRR